MIGAVRNDDRADWRQAWKLFTGPVAYVWHAGVKSVIVAQSLEACGFQIRRKTGRTAPPRRSTLY
jgi:hypothetical protein